MELSKTGRRELMRRQGNCLHLSIRAVDEAVAEAAALRERFPNADIPEGVTGGFLIPPEYPESFLDILITHDPVLFTMSPPITIDDAEIERIKAEFEKRYQGTLPAPESIDDVRALRSPVIIPPPVGVSPFVELSPREESLLREAPVFHLSPLEPQPDIVVSPKEP